ncbi:hypothetical protein NDU88_006899 [Pleurodeles waltl]|uniref:Secreted protein n=1 Tax=Pleurodeles waltl TaxID=8319 RepID=A0AAV7N2Q4_PLEWA|nr:hypothetical protein NDU88_006899 [Pleurodeles waltl]
MMMPELEAAVSVVGLFLLGLNNVLHQLPFCVRGHSFPTLQFGTRSGVDLGSLVTSRPTDRFLHGAEARSLKVSECSDAFFGIASCVWLRFLSLVSPIYSYFETQQMLTSLARVA